MLSILTQSTPPDVILGDRAELTNLLNAVMEAMRAGEARIWVDGREVVVRRTGE